MKKTTSQHFLPALPAARNRVNVPTVRCSSFGLLDWIWPPSVAGPGSPGEHWSRRTPEIARTGAKRPRLHWQRRSQASVLGGRRVYMLFAIGDRKKFILSLWREDYFRVYDARHAYSDGLLGSPLALARGGLETGRILQRNGTCRVCSRFSRSVDIGNISGPLCVLNKHWRND